MEISWFFFNTMYFIIQKNWKRQTHRGKDRQTSIEHLSAMTLKCLNLHLLSSNAFKSKERYFYPVDKESDRYINICKYFALLLYNLFKCTEKLENTDTEGKTDRQA